MIKTFPNGGVHPEEQKITAGKEIRTLGLPSQVSVPVSQHIGAPAEIQVERGDTVQTGQQIASVNGFVSANIHAPVSGKVKKIDTVMDVSGYRRQAVIIKTDEDKWLGGINRSDELIKDISPGRKEIIKKIEAAGLVGQGGATFPSHVKLNVPRGKTATHLLVNGVECEPYLTSDHALMMEKGRELMVGIRIMMKALDVDQAIIGIENNKPDAIEHLHTLAMREEGIRVQALKVKYPQGGEKQLIKAVLNREVPSGGLPIDVGVVVFNVGTVFSAYEAVQKNKPFIERIVTVTGTSLTDPGVFRVRIGTPVSDLIDAAGGLPEDTGKVISGGPMMGKALNDLNVPVTKGMSGILILPEPQSHRQLVEPCIRCTKCVKVCPMALEPYLLMSLAEHEETDRMEAEKAMDCIECGSCSYICPASRPLLDYIRLGKSAILKQRRSG